MSDWIALDGKGNDWIALDDQSNDWQAVFDESDEVLMTFIAPYRTFYFQADPIGD